MHRRLANAVVLAIAFAPATATAAPPHGAADATMAVAESPSPAATAPERGSSPAATVPGPRGGPPRSEPTVILVGPADRATLPPAPDPNRPATARLGAAVAPPRLPEPDRTPTVILPVAEPADVPAVAAPTDGPGADAVAEPPAEAAPEEHTPEPEDAAVPVPGAGPEAGAAALRPLVSVADLIGRRVRDETGAAIGEVADILVSLDTIQAEAVVVVLDGSAAGALPEGSATLVAGDRVTVAAAAIAIDAFDGTVVVPRSALHAE